MKLKKEILKNHQIKVSVEVEKEQFDKFKAITARNISKESKISGFRPGKAPYDVIERTYGEEYIVERTIHDYVNKVYPEVIEELELKPYGPGKLDEITAENPPHYTFIIPLEPEINIGDYKSVKLPYKLPSVKKKEVDEVIENIRTRYATAEQVDRPAEKGDLVVVRISAELEKPDEGQEKEVLNNTPHQIVLGDHPEDEQFPFKGFMNKLVGLNINEEKEFSHTFAKDSEYEKLQGKKATFQITVESIKEMTKPEIDNDFVKSLGFEKIENLTEAVEDQLSTDKKNKYENEYFDKLLDKLIKISDIKYPPEMLEDEIEDIQKNFEQNLAKQNLDLETYLKLNKRENDEFIEEEIKPAAIKRLEQALVLEEISKAEKVDLDKTELQQAYTQSFLQMKAAPNFKEMQKKMTTQKMSNAVIMQTASHLMHQKTLQCLKSIANGELEEEFQEKQPDKNNSDQKISEKKDSIPDKPEDSKEK